MKTRRSRKAWARTEYHRRKDKSVKRITWWNNAPHWYRHLYYVKPFRRKCNEITRALADHEPDEMVFPLFKKDACWTWW